MFRSLRWKISFTYVMLVISSMLVLGTFLMRSLENYFLDNLRTQMLIEARLIAQMMENNVIKTENQNKVSGFNQFAQSLAETTKVKTGTRVTIVDQNGVVWGDSAEDPRTMENHLNRPEIIDALKQGEGWVIRQSHTLGNNMLYVSIPVKTKDIVQGFVRLAIPLTEVEQTIHQLWRMILASSVLGLLVAGLLGLVLARRTTRPIEEMIRTAREISQGDFTSRHYSTGSDELGILAESLNHMALTLKNMLEEVSTGKTRLESVLNNMVSGVIFVGQAGKVDLINPAALRILSIERGNKSTVTLEAINSLDNKINIRYSNVSEPSYTDKPYSVVIRHFLLSSLIDEVMVSREPRREEIQILTPTEKVIEVNLSPITSQGQNLGLVVVLHDITELRRLERIRSDFVANVSHELKTPITSVKGFAETLLEGALDERQVAEEFVRIIYQETDRLTAIVNDLLLLSKIESQPDSIKIEPFEITAFIKHVGNKFGPALQAQEHQLILDLPTKEVWVLGDPYRLEQVIDNLVDNAIKYTPPSGLITLKVEEMAEGARIEVCDTGIGIGPEERKRIFERFYRVDKARSRKVGGTGLGLSIVKHILEAHAATIEVRDGDQKGMNKGTCFSFTLKLATRNA